MYTSGPGEASRLLNTPILGAAGAGQVISIIRGEGSHTYGNAAVGGGEGWWYGWGWAGSWGVTFESGVGVLGGVELHEVTQRRVRARPVPEHFFLSRSLFLLLLHLQLLLLLFHLHLLCGSPLLCES